MSRDHRKLRAFTEADELAIEAYRLTARFPLAERYGLQAQLRRSAVSVPCNIVEGSARSSTAEYCRFLEIARSSSAESEYLFGLSGRLEFLRLSDAAAIGQRYSQLQRVLYAAEKSLRES